MTLKRPTPGMSVGGTCWLAPSVVAFSATADVEMGDYDENPVILFKSGRLPHPFDEA